MLFKLEKFVGKDINQDLVRIFAGLRVLIFKEYPYLYEGDETFEQ